MLVGVSGPNCTVLSRLAAVVLLFTMFASVGCGAPPSSDSPIIYGPSGPCDGDCDGFYVPPVPPDEVRILTYNVFLRPPPINALDEPWCRAQRIGDWLAQSDAGIVALQETFQPEPVAALVDQARYALPYQVLNQPAPKSRLGASGGLSILSRWPIEEARTLTFDACNGPFSDCLAAKGAVHAVVRLSDNTRLNVVATHLDAGGSSGNRDARAAQLAQLREFIDEIDTDLGPIVALGDFNIDALLDDGEYDDLVRTLDVTEDDRAEDPSTINCKTNIFCNEPAAPERLDHVFTRAGEQRLLRTETRHLPMSDQGCAGARYLSDHRAVWSTFATDL
jgi:endonuclease/exonuclease/phosphatase family metal-dependent hydrolase